MLQGPAVEEEDVPCPAEEARELVEEPRGDPDELVLRPAQELRQPHPGRVVDDSAGPTPGTSPACKRKSASEACKLAELERPAPRGTSPAIAASNPDARAPWASCKAQTTPRT